LGIRVPTFLISPWIDKGTGKCWVLCCLVLLFILLLLILLFKDFFVCLFTSSK
jgi:hypothetical protein